MVQLFDAILQKNTSAKFDAGIAKIHDSQTFFDVIHFHWPEEIFDWKVPSGSQINSLSQLLESRKKDGVRIISTIHNEIPHGRDTTPFQQLYATVFSMTDTFIHLGESSRTIMEERYGNLISKKENLIIRHGDYSIFPNSVSKNEARKTLNVPDGFKVVLSFGELRTIDELNLLLDGFKGLAQSNVVLIHAGRLPATSRKSFIHYTKRLRFRSPRSQLREGRVEASEVQNFLNASDVLFIPRNCSLNSGNVALGFTFGRVVAGPTTGVIGEYLMESGNPTFQPESIETVSRAIADGLILAQGDKGKENRVWCNRHMNWQTIADQHLDAYRVR